MAEEKKPAAKKPAAKSTASKSTAAKSSTAKKTTAAKSSTTKSTAAKKPAAKSTAAKSSTTKSSTAKSTAAKKPAAKSTAAKSSTAKSTPAKAASTAKSTAAKSTTAASSSASAAKKAASTEPKVNSLRMHHLRPAEGAHKKKTRVGRGEASKGKTAGRGTKGTGARYQVPERFEGGQTPIHMRIPKLKGFKNPFKTEYQVVNVDQINELFPKGGKVTKADLVAKGAVRKNQLVKVLGDGDITVKVEIVDADRVSQSAKSKIEAAGGTVNAG